MPGKSKRDSRKKTSNKEFEDFIATYLESSQSPSPTRRFPNEKSNNRSINNINSISTHMAPNKSSLIPRKKKNPKAADETPLASNVVIKLFDKEKKGLKEFFDQNNPEKFDHIIERMNKMKSMVLYRNEDPQPNTTTDNPKALNSKKFNTNDATNETTANTNNLTQINHNEV
jgi:hypothetical protein